MLVGGGVGGRLFAALLIGSGLLLGSVVGVHGRGRLLVFLVRLLRCLLRGLLLAVGVGRLLGDLLLLRLRGHRRRRALLRLLIGVRPAGGQRERADHQCRHACNRPNQKWFHLLTVSRCGPMGALSPTTPPRLE